MKAKVAVFMALYGVACSATPITVPNFSFETATLPFNSGDGPFNNLIAGSTDTSVGGTLGSWTASSTTTGVAVGAFSPNASGFNWGSAVWWTGSNVAYFQFSSPGTASLTDVLAANLVNNTTYTLTVDIGRRGFTANFNYAIELFAGSTLLGSASNLSLTGASSGTDSLMYASGASNALAGQALSIVLTSTEAAGVAGTEAFFDNVRLDGSPTVTSTPEPDSYELVGLGAMLLGCASGWRIHKRG